MLVEDRALRLDPAAREVVRAGGHASLLGKGLVGTEHEGHAVVEARHPTSGQRPACRPSTASSRGVASTTVVTAGSVSTSPMACCRTAVRREGVHAERRRARRSRRRPAVVGKLADDGRTGDQRHPALRGATHVGPVGAARFDESPETGRVGLVEDDAGAQEKAAVGGRLAEQVLDVGVDPLGRAHGQQRAGHVAADALAGADDLLGARHVGVVEHPDHAAGRDLGSAMASRRSL